MDKLKNKNVTKNKAISWRNNLDKDDFNTVKKNVDMKRNNLDLIAIENTSKVVIFDNRKSLKDDWCIRVYKNKNKFVLENSADNKVKELNLSYVKTQKFSFYGDFDSVKLFKTYISRVDNRLLTQYIEDSNKCFENKKNSQRVDYKSQGGFFEGLFDLKDGLCLFAEMLQAMGKSKNIIDRFGDLWKLFVTDVLTLIKQISAMNFDGSFDSLSTVLLALAKVLIWKDILVDKTRRSSFWFGQSGDALLFSAFSMLFPKEIMEILKRMSMFSNTKIFDECDTLVKVIACVSDLLSKLIVFCKLDKYIDVNKVFFMGSTISAMNALNKARDFLEKWQKNKNVVLEFRYREDIATHYKDNILGNIALVEWCQKSKGANSILKDFERLVKIVNAYDSQSKVEPNCFVFEGKPGTMKSVTMLKVIQLLNKTTYTHLVKSIKDGKDFYDGYNNEEIYVQDDVGQQGVSQWRTIINLVSAVKTPLDCASAELKDTKFFSSKNILVTTNCFMNIQGLTSQDCISDIAALWRRGYVFKFNVIRRGELVKGIVDFYHYSLDKQKFVNQFTPEFSDEYGLNASFEVEYTQESNDNLLIWIANIISIYTRMKEDNHHFTEMDMDKLNTLRERLIFNAQGGGQSSPVDPDIKNAMQVYDGDPNAYRYYNRRKYLTAIELLVQVLTYYGRKAKKYLKELFVAIYTGEAQSISQAIGVMLFYYAVMFGTLTAVQKCASKVVLYKVHDNVKNMDDQNRLEFLRYYYGQGSVSVQLKSLIEENKVDVSSVHTSVNKVFKSVFECDVYSSLGIAKNVCTISGRTILLPAHITEDEKVYIVVYKSRELNHREIDHVQIVLQKIHYEEDLGVWYLPSTFPSTYPTIKNQFNYTSDDQITYLVHPLGIINLMAKNLSTVNDGFVYKIRIAGREGKIVPGDVTYDIQADELCGSLLVTKNGVIRGHHVAGCVERGSGAGKVWKTRTIDDIVHYLSASFLKIETDVSGKLIEDFSGVKLNCDLHSSVQHKSNFVPSELHGVFPVTRFPANLHKFGTHTVKDVSKASRIPVAPCAREEIEFGKEVVDLILEDFQDISMTEVICGNDLLAGMNKKSSNGICDFKNKDECFDWENKCMLPKFANALEEYTKRICSDSISVRDLAWVETLKDEIRNQEKDTPRSFRISNVYIQVLTKKLFGEMVSNIVSNRQFNNIMIGVNPSREWPRLYDTLKQGAVWAGDIGKYDKKMLPQVQGAVNEVIMKHYKGNNRLLAERILDWHIYCVSSVMDDTYISTHGMPSGSYLTAIVNSLVNRFYKAMWYKRNVHNAKAVLFYKDIVDMVYGDDTVNVLLNLDLQGVLNAISMKEFFVSCGMDFTTSTKGEVISKFEDIEEVTFLKRSFKYHSKLKQVACPLDTRTILSGISWIDKTKDSEIVIQDKLHCIQRELFLHEELYKDSMKILEEECTKLGIKFVKLPEKYLIDLYKSGEYIPKYDSSQLLKM